MTDKAKVIEIEGTDLIGVEVGGEYIHTVKYDEQDRKHHKQAMAQARAYAEGWNAAWAQRDNSAPEQRSFKVDTVGEMKLDGKRKMGVFLTGDVEDVRWAAQFFAGDIGFALVPQ